VDLDDVGLFLLNEAANLIETGEQVVGRVVGEGGSGDPDHAGEAGVFGEGGVRVAWAWSDHDGAVSELAQNVSFSGEMAPNSTSSFRVKLGDIDNFHGTSGRLRAGARSRGGNVAEALATPVSPASPLAEVHPFTELASRLGRPLRVAILSDFTRIPYANGAVFQTRFLYQELRRCGHEVTVIGPSDPESRPEDLAPGTIALPSLPLKTYPGVHVPLPLASWVAEIDRWDFDLCFAQTTSMLMEFGVWLREMKGIPLICVNTTHLTAAYDVLLPEKLSKIPAVHKGLEALLKRPYENLFTNLYNRADGLIVLSEGATVVRIDHAFVMREEDGALEAVALTQDLRKHRHRLLAAVFLVT
jgi:hypothetical protein